MITAMEMEDLARFCDLMGIILFSDEMYRGLEPEPEDRLPCAAGLSFNSIALSGMSKAFSLPGLRIGWLVCRNPGIRDKLIRLKDYTTICSSAPSEILALIALQNREKIISRNLAIIRKNTGLVEAFVDSSGGRYSWRPPEAGSVAMLDLPGGTSSEEFCRDLLEKKQVLAIGSHLFGLSKPAIRLGLGRESFGEALERGLTDGRRRTAGKARI
jgi:aspartate/methionine/tyrosine aminotransferase